THLGAGEEITSAPGTAAAHEEAELRVVQRGIDVVAKANGAALTNARDEVVAQIRGHPPAAANVTSVTCPTTCGNTPKSNVTAAVMPRAANNDGGMRIGATSPSGT